jgi:UDP-N-acetylmuramoylalanine--D-glutamate ligase
MMKIKGKKVLVLGLGVSGYAAAELLATKGAKVKVSEAARGDEIGDRLKDLARYGVRCETGGHTADFCGDAEIVVASPGVDTRPLYLSGVLKKECELIGELELGYMFCRAPIIAITGTNGKSTVTELIGRILSSSGRHTVVCGNIGNPLSGETKNLTEESVAVVEVSSFQLETIRDFRPHVAVLLNIAEDHYQRHTNYDNYKAEKFKIFRNQSPGDWAVLHSDFRDDPMSRDIKSRLLFFGAPGSDAVLSKDGVTVEEEGKREIVVSAGKVPFRGIHNLENAAGSVLVSRIMGVDLSCICRGIATFKTLGHRFEKVGNFRGVEFIDDSKATNVDAVRRALESMDRKVVLIAGGKDKGGDYLSILPLVKKKVKAMVLIGEARAKIKDVFSSAVPVFAAENMAEAVKIASSVSAEGEAVMLSPMCSSFDMFSSYKERGEAFQSEVRLQASGSK